MTLGTYDPSQVAIIFGRLPITGFADGTFVSIEQNEDSFSLQIGTDGDGCRSKTNNQSIRVTFTLGQWSASNDTLSAQHNLDVLSPSGDGIAPLLVKDNSGRTLVAAENAWIVKPAPAEFGREAGPREWIIESDRALQNIGGN